MPRPLIAAALALALACPAMAAEPAPSPVSSLPFQELPTQKLEKGQCALFLWARSTPPQRVLMALQNPAMARVRKDGRTVDLARVGFEGEAVYGHPRVQTFAADGLQLKVTIETDARSGLVGGVVVPTATIEYRSADGWETVIPAAGLIGCQD